MQTTEAKTETAGAQRQQSEVRVPPVFTSAAAAAPTNRDNLAEAHDTPANTTGGDASSSARGGRLHTTAIPATTFQIRRWPATTAQRPMLRANV
jgi:hypothetical protein